MKKRYSFAILGLIFGSMVAFALFTLVFFVFGWRGITGLPGTDSLSFLSRLRFLSDYFPNYPFWDHIEGAGVSAKYGYPILVHTVVIIIERMTSLNLVESTKLVGFASVPLFATGLFLLGSVRFRNPMIGILAGLFYVVSPISRALYYDWGFLAASVAMSLSPFILLFYLSFFESYLVNGFSVKTRLYSIGTILFMALSFFAHPTVLFGSLFFIGLYTFIRSLLLRKFDYKQIVKNMLISLVLFIATILLIFSGFKPFYEYSIIAGKSDVSGGVRVDEYERNDLELSEVLSLDIVIDETDPAYNFRNVSFLTSVSILFVVGLLVVWFYKKRDEMAFHISVLLVLFATVSTPFILILVRIPFISYFASWRTLMYGARIGIPLIAAYGAYKLPALLALPFKKLRKNIVFNVSTAIIFSTIAVIVSGVLFVKLLNYPEYDRLKTKDLWAVRKDDPCGGEEYDPYCESSLFTHTFNVSEFHWECANLEDTTQGIIPDLCNNVVNETTINEIVSICNQGDNSLYNETICTSINGSFVGQATDWEQWREMASRFYQREEEVVPEDNRSAFEIIPDDPFIRYDSTPHTAVYSMIGPYFKNTPQMTVYINQNSLIHRLWGYQISNFYAEDPVFEDNKPIGNIAKSYGIGYIIVNRLADRIDDLKDGGFDFIGESSVMKSEDDIRTSDISSRPKILVVGSYETPTVYEDVYKKSAFGIADYEEAFWVKGPESVDDFSLTELSEFDVVLMHGYTYKDTEKAWRLLDEYVSNGGNLFVETGWEFTAADYDVGETPPFFPTTSLEWTNLGVTSSYSLFGGLIETEGIDVARFEPLEWEGLPWGLSIGSTLRSWAKPILSVKGKTVIAGGSYGSGRVVWSGMNILNHIDVFDHTHPEMVMVGRMFDYLLGNGETDSLIFGVDYTAKRKSPDEVVFTIQKPIEHGSLYFKEANYPRWRATVNKKGIDFSTPIFTSGPGYMLIDLDEMLTGDTITFKIKTPVGDYVAKFISVLTIIVLGIFLVRPSIFAKFKFKGIPKLTAKNPFEGIMDNDEDTNY